MSYTLLLGEGLFAAMHPMVAQAAKSYEVVDVKAKGGISCPWLDVVGRASRHDHTGTSAMTLEILTLCLAGCLLAWGMMRP